jgi:hypothetical protein
MPVPLTCPTCRKRLVVRDELRGRRVKCSACATPFDVPRVPAYCVAGTETTNPLDDPPAPAAYAVAEDRIAGAAAVPPPLPRSAAPPPPAQRVVKPDWSSRERFFLRTGLQVLAVGVLALVLPLFGLQLRRLHAAGEHAGAVGAGLVVLGALASGVVLLRRATLRPAREGTFRVPTPYLVAAVAAIPAACVVSVVVAIVIHLPRRPTAIRPPAGPGAPRQAPPGAGAGPSVTPPFPPSITPPPLAPGDSPAARRPPVRPSPPNDTPADPSRRDWIAAQRDASVVRQFGADRVARVIVTGLPASPVIDRTLENKVTALLPRGRRRLSTSRYADGRVLLIAAPLEDLSALERALDVGTITAVDRDSRTIHLTVDSSRLRAPQ